MSTMLKATDTKRLRPQTPNPRSPDPPLANNRHTAETLQGAESSPLERGKESDLRADTDWQLIRRMMQNVLGDHTWPKGRTSDGEAQLDKADNGEPLWRVGHQSYQVLRHEPRGAEELIEAGPNKTRRIGWGVIHEDHGIVIEPAKPEATPSRPTERDASDHIRRRGARRSSRSRAHATGR